MRIQQIFLISVKDVEIPINHLNRFLFLQTVLSGKKIEAQYFIEAPTRMENRSEEDGGGKISVYFWGLRGFIAWHVFRAWISFVISADVGSLKSFTEPYVLFDDTLGYINVLKNRKHSFGPKRKNEDLSSPGMPVHAEADAKPSVWARYQNTDLEYRYMTQLMFDPIDKIILNYELYNIPFEKIVEWAPVKAFVRSSTSSYPYVFSQLPDSVVEVFDITRHVAPPLEIIDIENMSTTNTSVTSSVRPVVI